MTRYPSFSAHRDDVWSQLTAAVGDPWDGEKVVVQSGPWMLVLDSYRATSGDWQSGFTRISAPLINPEGFRFTVYEKGPFSWLGKLLGMQDIEIGDSVFDDNWVVQSNSPPKIRSFLQNAEFRELITSLPECEFTLRDDEGEFDHPGEDGEQFDELLFSCAGLLVDREQLDRLFRLFAGALTRLCTLSAAYE